MNAMKCREGCGACCIAPSITSAMPLMPEGKPAGMRCLHLTPANLCDLFGKPERPAVCGGFKADPEVCGADNEEAIRILGWWERMTAA